MEDVLLVQVAEGVRDLFRHSEDDLIRKRAEPALLLRWLLFFFETFVFSLLTSSDIVSILSSL